MQPTDATPRPRLPRPSDALRARYGQYDAEEAIFVEEICWATDEEVYLRRIQPQQPDSTWIRAQALAHRVLHAAHKRLDLIREKRERKGLPSGPAVTSSLPERTLVTAASAPAPVPAPAVQPAAPTAAAAPASTPAPRRRPPSKPARSSSRPRPRRQPGESTIEFAARVGDSLPNSPFSALEAELLRRAAFDLPADFSAAVRPPSPPTDLLDHLREPA